MPFDPTFPATNAPLASATFRDQFNGLKALIDTLTTQVSALQAQVNALQGQVEDLSDSVADELPTRPTFDETLAMIQSNAATNIDSIAPLDASFSDPPTSTELDAVAAKINDVISGLQA